MNTTLKYLYIIITLSLLFTACRTLSPDCFKEDMADAKFKWGTYNSTDKTFDGFMLNSKSVIYKLKRDKLGKETYSKYVTISENDACRIVGLYYWAMKTVQTCNEPGNDLKFLNYVNENTNLHWFVVWNQSFNTGSNSNLKIVNDSLNIILKKYMSN